MARKTDRNFIADFAALDIEYLPIKGPKVSDDIQMVYVMGNVAPAAAAAAGGGTGLQLLGAGDNATSTVGVSANVSGVAAQRCGIELVVDAGLTGVWCSPTVAGTGQLYDIWTAAVPIPFLTTLVPTVLNSTIFGNGLEPASTVNFSALGLAPLSNSLQFRLGEDEGGTILYHPMFWVAGGRTIILLRNLINATTIFGWVWREIP